MADRSVSCEETRRRSGNRSHLFSESTTLQRSSAFETVLPTKYVHRPLVVIKGFLSGRHNSEEYAGDNNLKRAPIADLEDFVSSYFNEESSEEAFQEVKSLSKLQSLKRRSRCDKGMDSYKRVNFSVLQSEILERSFQFKQDVSPSSAKWLAKLLGLPKRRVVTWFQNRRARERKRAGIKLPRHGMKCSRQLQSAECERLSWESPFNSDDCY